ncbi:hypothetical protein [Vibrio hyugaensis]|uniref:hypothetical protein n=1 Tax=Vibrio hyugaensis TaxID=1534743 RepID=UPI0005F03C54|nr:hypothetical protein [Vibrio hyugaensis]
MNIYKKATLDNLPCLIEIEKIEKPNDNFFVFIMLLGSIVAVIGLFTVFTGPEAIYYDRISGPTFEQYIQLYPGPIASIGILLFNIGNYYIKKNKEEYLLKLDIHLRSAIDISDDEIPEGYELGLGNTDSELVYKCFLKWKVEPSDQSERTAEEAK